VGRAETEAGVEAMVVERAVRAEGVVRVRGSAGVAEEWAVARVARTVASPLQATRAGRIEGHSPRSRLQARRCLRPRRSHHHRKSRLRRSAASQRTRWCRCSRETWAVEWEVVARPVAEAVVVAAAGRWAVAVAVAVGSAVETRLERAPLSRQEP
jgi:hypothetical protein